MSISGLTSNNQLNLWGSATGLNYQVLATTNLAQPFLPISDSIPSQYLTASNYDPSAADQKFCQIEMVPKRAIK